MKTYSLIFPLLLSALGSAQADDHMDVNEPMEPIQPEDILVEEETVQMPLYYKVMQSDMPLPTRGMSQNKVKADFGEPTKVISATGTPPISRWIYADYTVYFESGWVIHSVRNP